MKAGQTVYWQRTTNGRPVPTHIRAIETITRSDGSNLVCAVLACNRFVPVTELLEIDNGSEPLETQSQDRDHQSDFGSRPERPKEAETSDLSSVSVRRSEDASVQDLAGRGPAATGTVFTERRGSGPKETEEPRKGDGRGGTDSVEPAAIGPDDTFRLNPASGGRQSPDDPRTDAQTDVRTNRNQGIDIPRSPDPVAGSSDCGPLLIDFNNLLVRAWHAGKPSEIHAVKSMFLTVAAAVRSLRPSGIVFCLDGGHDHRAKLYPAYKAHRPPSDPDLVRQRKLAIDAIDFAGLQLLRAEGFEADDVIATLAKRCGTVSDRPQQQAVILSSDKDLLALAGVARIYHPWGAGKFVQPEDVLGVPAGQVTDYLALCGDTSDGIPGVLGVGEKTAQKLLAAHGNLETILAKARFQHILGSLGENLRSRAADALLSQQLVQLVTTLKLAELQPWRPRHGWQQRLTDMRLGSIAGILDGIAELLTASGGLQSPDNPRTDQHAEQTRSRNQGTDVPRSPEVVTRSITEPIRLLLTVSQLWDGPDRGMICCWECGREMAAARWNESRNPWKQGTPNHKAWLQGHRGEDLHVLPPTASGGRQSPDESRTDARTEPRMNRNQGIDIPRSPERVTSRSLFD